MSSLHAPPAITKHFEFDQHTVVFSSLIVTKPLSEREKRALIFAGIAAIENLPDDEKDLGECSSLLSGLVEEMLAQTVWHEPRHPVFIYAHTEMCLPCLCSYMKRIRQQIITPSGIACGLIDVPRTLFQALEQFMHPRLRIPPLTAQHN